MGCQQYCLQYGQQYCKPDSQQYCLYFRTFLSLLTNAARRILVQYCNTATLHYCTQYPSDLVQHVHRRRQHERARMFHATRDETRLSTFRITNAP